MVELFFLVEERKAEKNLQFLTKENSNNDTPSFSYQELDLNQLFATQQFNKLEILKSKKLISELFLSKQSISNFPFRLIWNITDLKSPYPAQIAFSVPKRTFKKAVDRNAIKRQMREVYRLNRQGLYKSLKNSGQQAAFMLLFTGKKKYIYKELETKFNQLAQRFIEQHEHN